MKVVTMVDGVFVGLVAFAFAVGCSPSVTVSREGEAVSGEGGMDATGGTAGRSSVGGADANGGGIGDGGRSIGGAGSSGTGGTVPTAGGGGTGGITCPCSRRPDAPISRSCPRGAGLSRSATIGASGGDIELSGTASTMGAPFRVRIFPGSLAADTEITLTELTLAPPEEVVDYSPVYRIEPEELDFENGGEVTIPWQGADGEVPSDLAIHYSESADGPFERMADSYTNAGFSQATLLRSGYFWVGAPKDEELEHCP